MSFQFNSKEFTSNNFSISIFALTGFQIAICQQKYELARLVFIFYLIDLNYVKLFMNEKKCM